MWFVWLQGGMSIPYQWILMEFTVNKDWCNACKKDDKTTRMFNISGRNHSICKKMRIMLVITNINIHSDHDSFSWWIVKYDNFLSLFCFIFRPHFPCQLFFVNVSSTLHNMLRVDRVSNRFNSFYYHLITLGLEND